MAHWTAHDIPDQSGRTAIVTGANSGIGFPTALELARRGARVVLAGRSEDSGRAAVERIRAEVPDAAVEWASLDLADLASVRRFAAEFGGEQLNVLVNNAGVMALPRQRTADGFEAQFGINHLGHFALTGLLLPALLAAPGARVVTVSSHMHRQGQIEVDDLMGERHYNRVSAYSNSKLANLLFALELQRRIEGAGVELLSLAAHPGYAATSIGRYTGPVGRMFMWAGRLVAQPAAQGALPTLYASTAPNARGGEFYGPGSFRNANPSLAQPSSSAQNEDAARLLWERSEQLTGVRFDAIEPLSRS